MRFKLIGVCLSNKITIGCFKGLFIIYFMFAKNEMLREYYWTDTATRISAIRIELIDQKTTTLKVGERSENKNLPYPEASRVIITRNAQNDDLILDYLHDGDRLAQEIISGHTIAKVSVEFPC
ncbi:MAG: hypothetical protein WCC17_18865 [Candidatus Nitrosopolaris sp.]